MKIKDSGLYNVDFLETAQNELIKSGLSLNDFVKSYLFDNLYDTYLSTRCPIEKINHIEKLYSMNNIYYKPNQENKKIVENFYQDLADFLI